MNETILIPYIGSFLSLFLLAVSFSVKNEASRKAFTYALIILSALNLYLIATLEGHILFLILNGGLLAQGASSLLSND
jgi:hypothetical protein